MKTKFSLYRTLGQLATATFMVGLLVMNTGTSQAQSPTGTPDMPQEDVVKVEGYQTWEDATDKEGGVVDIFDLTFVAARFNSTNPAADLNNDGKVDIFDLSLLAANYGKEGADSQAAATPPTVLPQVAEGQKDGDFGTDLLSVEANQPELEAQHTTDSYTWRPLRVGIGIDHVWTWDGLDVNSPPDFYAVASVGGSFARTSTVLNKFDTFPYWRLGWWNYNKGFPQFDSNNVDGDKYSITVTLEIRDDDGRTCYGRMGCWYGYETADLSSVRGQRIKTITFYPSSCKAVDETGTWITGTWQNNGTTRCRVALHTWGNEWPRASAYYFIDSQWY